MADKFLGVVVLKIILRLPICAKRFELLPMILMTKTVPEIESHLDGSALSCLIFYFQCFASDMTAQFCNKFSKYLLQIDQIKTGLTKVITSQAHFRSRKHKTLVRRTGRKCERKCEESLAKKFGERFGAKESA
jgi:hypothetical protein